MGKKKNANYAKKIVNTKLNDGKEVDLSHVMSEVLDVSAKIELDAVNSPKAKKIRGMHISEVPPPMPSPPPILDSDKTVPIQPENINLKELDRPETKVSYGKPNVDLANVSSMSQQSVQVASSGGSVEMTLKQSEHLRIAQEKMNELEEEIDSLRRENSDLASAGETYKQTNERYYLEVENFKCELSESKEAFRQELGIYKQNVKDKDKQLKELHRHADDLNSKIEVNFRKIRKREKDLEHRLEIAKVEEGAIIKSKDKMILDLKRKVDQISLESDNFRKKSQQNFEELQKKQQLIRGVVRALRLALTKLEGDLSFSDEE